MATKCCVSAMAGKLKFTPTLVSKSIQCRRYSSKMTPSNSHNFGFFFDIDGVLMRGNAVLPSAREAFHLLTDTRGRFSVPTIFVTNSGNSMRHEKAHQLSEILDVSISADQVVMSHSPLHMFRQYLNKHVLISGQGPVREIAHALGFTNVSTIGTIRHAFPLLDNVDHKRRKAAPCAFEQYFPKIDVILLLGEPVRWETNLQILIDMLLTDGQPSGTAIPQVPDPHIPVLACNMDLMWMSEAKMPRFGHGCFLHCLESLYQKITGHTLKYTALVGKPSELTYSYCEILLQAEARRLGLPSVKRIYCVGDNPESDIYGANLFDRYLAERQHHQAVCRRGNQTVDIADGGDALQCESCESILVCTGVYSRTQQDSPLHCHRDFNAVNDSLTTPSLKVLNVLEAVQGVYTKEGVTFS